jgi:hypothetical protein
VQHAAGDPGDTITVTASAALFAATDVGRQFRSHAGIIDPEAPTFWGCGVISAFTSTTVVSVLVVRGFSDTLTPDETRNWRLGAWYTDNYPSSITFDDQRLVFGADPANPQTLYFSVVDDFTNFTPTGDTNRAATNTKDTPAPFTATALVTNEVFADNGFTRSLSANDRNRISWLASLKTLVLATLRSFFQVQASSNVEALEPGNASARRAYARGGSRIMPAIVDEAVVYASPARGRLYRAAYSLTRESYSVEDLSLLATHLFAGRVRQMAWANEPSGVLWVVTEDGRLLSGMIETQQESLAWSPHPIGGAEATVESVCVIPAPDGEVSTGAHENRAHDQLWIVARRLVNGIYRRSVEFLEDDFPDDLDREHAFFVDSGLSFEEDPPVATLTGLDHLEGETVQALGDGSVLGEFVVSGGSITLPSPVERAHVGLQYVSRLRNARLERGDPQGSSQGKLTRTDHVTIRFYRTGGGEIAAGRDLGEFDPIQFENFDLALGDTELASEDVTQAVDTGWTTLGQVEIRQPNPLPMTVVAMVHRLTSAMGGTE